jgi:hypothetical protein
MVLVKLESTLNLVDALEQATRINNNEELNKIIEELNAKNFPDYKSFMKQIRVHMRELDPFEPETVVNYILENVRPELKNLVNPARMILSSSTSKPKWFQCFQGTRT